MLKTFIAPIQQWMLKRARCVGCGTPLEIGTRHQYKQGLVKVRCSCGRLYVFSEKDNTFRRALLEEA